MPMALREPHALRRRLYLAGGILALLLGAMGVVIPVLPTTPFLLLSAALLMRSSPRLYLWLTGNRLFGPFIHNYRLYRAVPLRSKVSGLIFLWLMLGSSAVFAVHSWWLRALLLVVGVLVSRHILRLKTLTAEMRNAPIPGADELTPATPPAASPATHSAPLSD